MRIEYHPAASQELIDATGYLEVQEAGLGLRFLGAFNLSLMSIAARPKLWRADSAGRRKYCVKRFPHHIIYKLKDNAIFVLAVAHTSRRPKYWKNRDEAK